MDTGQKNYWIGFVKKLSVDSDLDSMIPDVLEELCTTFDFGCGFVYECDYNRILRLRAHHERYANSLNQKELSLSDDLSRAAVRALATGAPMCFLDEAPEDELQAELGALFGAKSMILVPVIGKGNVLIALAGLSDRRAKGAGPEEGTPALDRRMRNPGTDEEISFAQAILSILGNYVKMQIYRRQAEDAQCSLEGTLDNMGIDVYVNDFNTHEILYINRSMAAPYGDAGELLGKPCWQVLYEDKTGECDFCPGKNLLDEDGNTTRVYSWDYQRPFDGAWFRVFSAAFPWVDGRMAHIVSSVDITENKRNEEIVRLLAEYDYLTGLPNRYSLAHRIETLVGKDDGNYSFCLLFFDLDGFKNINDTMGHKAGDEVLRRVCEMLMSDPLTQGRSFRYGGDEFVIMLDRNRETVVKVLEQLYDFFRSPIYLDEGAARVGASVGLSIYPDDDERASEIIRKADQAMYASKNAGKGCVYSYNGGNICPFDPGIL